MNKTIITVAMAMAGALSAGAASAVTYATTVVSSTVGGGTVSGTNSPVSALSAPDGSFFSLGNGGSIVLSFGTSFGGPSAVFEVTNSCNTIINDQCTNWPEKVEVFVSNSLVETDFISQGFVTNGGESVPGLSNTKKNSIIITGGPFTYVKLVDKTALLPGSDARFNSNAGFDVDAVSVTAVPLPAAAWLLLGGLGAMGLVARKRNRA